MKICLFKTKNGWIIHNDSYFSTNDADALLVFGSMKEVCTHLQKSEMPAKTSQPMRLPNGRFLPKTSALHPRMMASNTVAL
jgi:hypothetical protein